MSYKAITDKSSAQYKLIHSDQIVVGDDGLLYDGEYVGVAMASRFGKIGTKYIITLDDGRQFKAIKLDEKSDRHTINHCHHQADGSLIEFIIDVKQASSSYPLAIKTGNFNDIDDYKGVVTKVEALEFPRL